MIRIREAAIDAAMAETIAGLVNRAFSIESFFVEGDRITPAGIQALADNGTGTFFVAFDGGQAVGSVYAEIRPEGRGYFGLLAVDGRRQGAGVGRALITHAEDYFLAAGCRTSEITVVDARADLFPYYESRGYAFDGRSEPFPREAMRPCRLLCMSKPLGGS